MPSVELYYSPAGRVDDLAGEGNNCFMNTKTPMEDRVDRHLGDCAPLREVPTVKVPEYGEELYPDFVIAEPDVDGKPRMFVQIMPAGQDLEKALAKSAWQAWPARTRVGLCSRICPKSNSTRRPSR